MEAIAATRLMVVVFSGHANGSRQVIREVERAVNDGHIIIPFRIEDVSFSSALAFFLSTCHWLDALTPPLEAHMNRLADTIASFLSPSADEDKFSVGPRPSTQYADNTRQIQSPESSSPGTCVLDRIAVLTPRVTDWATSVAQRRNAVRSLGMLAREANSVDEKERVASAVVKALFDTNKNTRDMAASILGEIGPPAVDPILSEEVWKIPGREHGYEIAKRIFVEMGEMAVPTLVSKIDRDVYVITNALCDMPFNHVKEGCKQILARTVFSGRYREEIFRKMRSHPQWDEAELRNLLKLWLQHSDPLVRVLSAEWAAEAFPHEFSKVIRAMDDDSAMVERFYGPVKPKSVAEWVRDLAHEVQ
jgi:hypothetical protein